MPVTELIRYFNIADRSGDGALYPSGQRVEAWHAGFRLASLFRPIVNLQRECIVGHQAILAARHEDGTPAQMESVFAACESEPAIVYLDRLCRTLHALNFLSQRQRTGGYLQVPVHPRHLQAVPSQHGLVYEAILKRCGLAPGDIALDLDPAGLSSDRHFAHALSAYRRRGYRLALRVPDNGERLTDLLALQPDLLRLPTRRPELLGTARRQRVPLEQSGLSSSTEFSQAQADGIDLAQGPLFGDPKVDCLPTHASGRTSKIHHHPLEENHENCP